MIYVRARNEMLKKRRKTKHRLFKVVGVAGPGSVNLLVPW